MAGALRGLSFTAGGALYPGQPTAINLRETRKAEVSLSWNYVRLRLHKIINPGKGYKIK